jgi:hypothetical protein
MNADTDSTRLWQEIVSCWDSDYTFSVDSDKFPGEPYAAQRKDGEGTLRAASPGELLDDVKDDAARRPFGSVPAESVTTGPGDRR